MSTPAEYQILIRAITVAPPFKMLVAKLRQEDAFDRESETARTRRETACLFVKQEFGKIFNAVRDTEQAMAVPPARARR